jgi:O-antigen/teichoic acid export membrane protein
VSREDRIASVIEPAVEAAIDAETIRAMTGEPEIGWLDWAGRGAMAALEQGSVSGSNFVLSVAMARWLEPAAYGEYAVAFSMLLLGAAIYGAIFLVPLMLHLPTLDRPSKAGYLRALLRIHAWGSAGTLALAAAVCAAMSAAGWPAIAALTLASVFTTVAITFHWLLRDMHYAALSPAAPARGSLFYGIVLLGGLGVTWFTSAASSSLAIALMGLASLAAGAAQLPALRARVAGPCHCVSMAEVWRASRRSGRWELWNAIALWAPVHLTFPVTAGILGPGTTGALRALQNFAMPLNQIVAALSRLVFPYLCRHSSKGGEPLGQGKRIAWAAIGIGLAYTAMLWAAAGPAVRFLYGGAYDEHAWLMPLAVLPMAFWGGAQVLGLALRAAGRFPSVLAGSVAVGVVFTAAVVPATRAYGISGALAAAAGAQALGLVLFVLFARATSEHGLTEGGPA